MKWSGDDDDYRDEDGILPHGGGCLVILVIMTLAVVASAVLKLPGVITFGMFLALLFGAGKWLELDMRERM